MRTANTTSMRSPNIADLAEGLKSAMRGIAATVTLVTANENGVPYGMIATAVTSLALNPPSMVICVNANSSIHAPLLRSKKFCLNVLRPNHRHLCEDFSGKKTGRDRFLSGRWIFPENEPPSLEDAQANFFCEVDGTLPYGTHTVVVGQVTRVLVLNDIKPLLYQNADYGQFMPIS